MMARGAVEAHVIVVLSLRSLWLELDTVDCRCQRRVAVPEVPKSNSIVAAVAAALSFSVAELSNYSARGIIDQVCDPLSLIVAPHDTFVHPPSLALNFQLDRCRLNMSRACRAFDLIVFAIPIKIEWLKKEEN